PVETVFARAAARFGLGRQARAGRGVATLRGSSACRRRVAARPVRREDAVVAHSLFADARPAGIVRRRQRAASGRIPIPPEVALTPDATEGGEAAVAIADPLSIAAELGGGRTQARFSCAAKAVEEVTELAFGAVRARFALGDCGRVRAVVFGRALLVIDAPL